MLYRKLLPLVAALAPACTDPSLVDATADDPDTESIAAAVSCDPQMSVFPIAAPHNIGYDAASCGSGTCATSCPDQHANSDWGGSHHGIDLFAYRGAPLVAVAAGTIMRVGVASSTSGLRVRLRDDCGWEYYYGHLESAAVVQGQRVAAGQLIGAMGNSGTSGVHTHFNVSPDGGYSNDINPFALLVATSPTACGAPPPPPPPPPPPGACGALAPGEALGAGDARSSCDGRFTLAMQGDGNLVLYQGGSALWSSGTFGANHQLVMQPDGNLVIYRGGSARWSTGTHGHPGATLGIQDDGNVVLYAAGGGALWHTQTCCR